MSFSLKISKGLFGKVSLLYNGEVRITKSLKGLVSTQLFEGREVTSLLPLINELAQELGESEVQLWLSSYSPDKVWLYVDSNAASLSAHFSVPVSMEDIEQKAAELFAQQWAEYKAREQVEQEKKQQDRAHIESLLGATFVRTENGKLILQKDGKEFSVGADMYADGNYGECWVVVDGRTLHS